MLKVENMESFGWESAIRGMRNPLNSWAKSDSDWKIMNEADHELGYDPNYEFVVGKNDLKLMKTLSKSGSDHGKFLRMIHVAMDITAPLYWWKEFDTYKVGTTANSCSTMHKIAEKEFDRGDFSIDHILLESDAFSDTWNTRTSDMFFCVNREDGFYCSSKDIIDFTIKALNHYREKFLETKEKKFWWQMIQLLPSSYNQKRTVDLNYQVVKNMYFARRNHKLDEWHTLCEEFEELPYFKELILCEES